MEVPDTYVSRMTEHTCGWIMYILCMCYYKAPVILPAHIITYLDIESFVKCPSFEKEKYGFSASIHSRHVQCCITTLQNRLGPDRLGYIRKSNRKRLIVWEVYTFMSLCLYRIRHKRRAKTFLYHSHESVSYMKWTYTQHHDEILCV